MIDHPIGCGCEVFKHCAPVWLGDSTGDNGIVHCLPPRVAFADSDLEVAMAHPEAGMSFDLAVHTWPAEILAEKERHPFGGVREVRGIQRPE